ncbi:MAG: hypothetical protein BroJett039_10080 [Chloroflexota bacterium]|nr:MAG: hypothetical protein BroJett039_10080 [Chloroflexota bacterium]
MKFKVMLLTALVLAALVVSGCGMAKNLMGQNSGTVSDLWADVPPPPDATKANLDIPLPMQLVIQGFIQAANADSNSDTKLDKFDFIAFQSNQTAAQVAEFYTVEKMKAAGWNADDAMGCAGGTDSSSGVGAASFCAFAKQGDGGKNTVLMIIPYQEETGKPTQIFFIRFEATTKK